MAGEVLWWEEAQNGETPRHALEIGETADGEMLYIGRAYIDGDLVPGKIVPSQGCCFVGANNREEGHKRYEVLVSDKKTDYLEWIPASNGKIPEGAVVGGKVDATGEDLFVARGHPPDEPDGWHGGKLHASQGCVYIPYDGREVKVHHYEVLVDKS